MGNFLDYLNHRCGGEQRLGRLAQRQAQLDRIRQLLERVRPSLERYAGVERELTELMEADRAEQVEAILRDLPERLRVVDRQMEAVRRAEVLVPSADVGKDAFYDYCLHEMRSGDRAQVDNRQAAVMERIRQVNAAELARREQAARERARQASIRQEKTRLSRIPELAFFKGIREECCETLAREGVDAARRQLEGILPALHDLKESLETLARRTDLPATVKRRVPDLWNYCVGSLRSSGLQDARNRCTRLDGDVAAFRNQQDSECARVTSHPLVRLYPTVGRELTYRIDRGEFDGDGWSLATVTDVLNGLRQWQTYWAGIRPATPDIARRKAELDRFAYERMGCGDIPITAQRYVSLFSEHLAVQLRQDKDLTRFSVIHRSLMEKLQANQGTDVANTLGRIRQPLSDLSRALDATLQVATEQRSPLLGEIKNLCRYSETQMTEQDLRRTLDTARTLHGKVLIEKTENERMKRRKEEQEENRRRTVLTICLSVLGVAAVIGIIWYVVVNLLDTWWKIAIAVFIVGGIIVAAVGD